MLENEILWRTKKPLGKTARGNHWSSQIYVVCGFYWKIFYQSTFTYSFGLRDKKIVTKRKERLFTAIRNRGSNIKISKGYYLSHTLIYQGCLATLIATRFIFCCTPSDVSDKSPCDHFKELHTVNQEILLQALCLSFTSGYSALNRKDWILHVCRQWCVTAELRVFVSERGSW